MKLFLRLHWIFWRLSVEQAEKVYGLVDNPARMDSLKFLLDKIESDYKIVDVGCKYGDISALLAAKSFEVIGIDNDSEAIEIAELRHKSKNLSFVHSDAIEYFEKLNFRADVIILSHFIEQLEAPEDFLKLAKPHFRYLYIELPDFDDTSFNHYRKALNESLIYTDNNDLWVFDRDALKQMLTSCGLEIINEEYRNGVLKVWCKNSDLV